MGAVDNVAILGVVHVDLGAHFKAEMLGHVGGRPVERASNVSAVGDYGFDAVAFALDLLGERRHFVAVEGVGVAAVDVVRHGRRGTAVRGCGLALGRDGAGLR